ncbi:M50 family metallopeptidase [Fodinicola feengrottensis]|uniref:Zinc metalloprotease Rip1 n=1 Tax=Fodinicola feengrottensis TaxID=435914 RepID=A0ABN2H4A6_9ACTN
MWAYALGVVLVAIGILVSVYIHEAGHLVTAKMFGMKATRFFFGFGPTLWSFQKGETEYGIKALPFGGFCKILGMTPEEEDEMSEKDKPRSFIRFPAWKRTVVLVAGSLTHFVLAFVFLWVAILIWGITIQVPPAQTAAVVDHPAKCVVLGNETDSTGNPRPCKAGDPASPAAAAGLKSGDRVTSINSIQTPTYAAFQQALRKSPADGKTAVPLTYVRDGKTIITTVKLLTGQRRPLTASPNSKALVGTPVIGLYADLSRTTHYGPIDGAGKAAQLTGTIFAGTFGAIAQVPEKIPNLLGSLVGGHRDVNGPVSVVGVSRLGGESLENQGPAGGFLILTILASLNVFIGVFNLVPLLPMDGGHVIVAWFQRTRSWFALRRGRPDPGPVDYAKLLPLTYAVALVLVVFGVLTVAADIVNPIQIFQ